MGKLAVASAIGQVKSQNPHMGYGNITQLSIGRQRGTLASGHKGNRHRNSPDSLKYKSQKYFSKETFSSAKQMKTFRKCAPLKSHRLHMWARRPSGSPSSPWPSWIDNKPVWGWQASETNTTSPQMLSTSIVCFFARPLPASRPDFF